MSTITPESAFNTWHILRDTHFVGRASGEKFANVQLATRKYADHVKSMPSPEGNIDPFELSDEQKLSIAALVEDLPSAEIVSFTQRLLAVTGLEKITVLKAIHPFFVKKLLAQYGQEPGVR